MDAVTLEVATAPATRTDAEPDAQRGRYTIDIDTGGTFTDGFIADHRTGRGDGRAGARRGGERELTPVF